MEDFVVVVARFKEDVSWLSNSDIASHCLIYNKGPPLPPEVCEKCAGVIQLPNIGREAHTYLFHILRLLKESSSKNIEKNENRVHVFIQGQISDHVGPSFRKGKEIEFVKKMIKEAQEEARGLSLNHKAHSVGRNSALEDFRILSHRAKLFETNMAFGPWFRTFIDSSFMNPIKPTDVSWYIGALFAVKEKQIREKHETTFYEKLIETVSVDINPESAHFMERSWYHIFV